MSGIMKSMNPFGSSSPEPQTLLPGSVTNATEYTLKLLVDNDTNEIYVISKVANNAIAPTELTRLQTSAHVQKVFAKNKKIDNGINNFVNIGFDNALGDIPAPGSTTSVVSPEPVIASAPVLVSEADITDLLTAVRDIVNATVDDTDYIALVDADPTNNAIIDIVKKGVYPAVTKVEALHKLDDALAAVAGVVIDPTDTAKEKAIELVAAANIVAPVAEPAPLEAAAAVTEDDIRNLLRSVEIEVQGTADDDAFNALNGNIIDVVKAGEHQARTKDEAIQKLANAISAVTGVPIDQGDTAEGKAIELVNAANTAAPAPLGVPGGNKYTYGKQKYYPKNVTFSKKTISKQTHNKTMRKLQRILNDL